MTRREVARIVEAARALIRWHEITNHTEPESATLGELNALRALRDTLTGSSDERSENG